MNAGDAMEASEKAARDSMEGAVNLASRYADESMLSQRSLEKACI
jgi:hypothetical protein